VIQARLAQLSPTAPTLARLAATVGRAFTVELLVQASQQEEATVMQGLDELWRRRIVREQENGCYDFSHARIRDVVYMEISPVKRSFLHRQVAAVLVTLHEANLDPVYGQLAGHYEHAGLVEQAISCYQQAANHAKQLFAHAEVLRYRQKALQLVQKLPRTLENIQQQIDLLLAIGQAQIMISGWGSAPVGEAWRQAHQLAMVNGTIAQRVLTLDELARYHRTAGNWSASYHYATQALALAHTFDDPHLPAHPCFAVASVLLHQGDLVNSLSYFDLAQHQAKPGVDERMLVDILYRSGKCLWLLGFPEQALARGSQAVLRMRQSFPDGVCMALYHYGMILVFCRAINTLHCVAHELIALATEQDDLFSLMMGELYQGWCLAHYDEAEAGTQLVYASVDWFRRMRLRMFEPFWRGMGVEMLALAGKANEALAEVDALLTDTAESGNRYWDAYLLKVKGPILQTVAVSDAKVEQCYLQALATARQQKARSLELRAAASLARLWQQQGRIAEAHQRLSDIYHWFTEGFDTADLQEAKALLETLAPSRVN
jgi:tetratricopeptide (TPR) repeat protein